MEEHIFIFLLAILVLTAINAVFTGINNSHLVNLLNAEPREEKILRLKKELKELEDK
jgi:cell division protein FtsL